MGRLEPISGDVANGGNGIIDEGAAVVALFHDHRPGRLTYTFSHLFERTRALSISLDLGDTAVVVETQRAAALCLGDRRVLALMQTLCLFALHPQGVRHRDVRSSVAQLLGRLIDDYGASQMTYDLCRLRLHRLIERVQISISQSS